MKDCRTLPQVAVPYHRGGERTVACKIYRVNAGSVAPCFATLQMHLLKSPRSSGRDVESLPQWALSGGIILRGEGAITIMNSLSFRVEMKERRHR